MAEAFGFDLLHQQVLEEVREQLVEAGDWIVGDTEIERLFCAAIGHFFNFSQTEFNGILLGKDVDSVTRLLQMERSRDHIVVQPQAQLEGWRVDFLVHAWTYGTVWGPGVRTVGPERWRRLIVECDGHDFHERTKAQAAKDKSRDREFRLQGFDIFRFTGSELWKDPWNCARQVYDWAVVGV